VAPGLDLITLIGLGVFDSDGPFIVLHVMVKFVDNIGTTNVIQLLPSTHQSMSPYCSTYHILP
jgi:hypothetical protein